MSLVMGTIFFTGRWDVKLDIITGSDEYRNLCKMGKEVNLLKW